MSGTLLATRNRSFSQASIRKRMLRSNSEQNTQRNLVRNATMTSFKPKLERLIQEGKIQQIINSDKHSKANLLYSSHINDMQKELADSKKALSTMALKAKSKQFSINKLKNQIMRLQKQRQAIKANNEAITKIYDSTLLTLDSKKQSKQNTQWTQKSFVFIKQRCMKDEYFHKVNYQSKQKILQAQKQRSQFLQKKFHQITAQQKQLQLAVQQAKVISSQETFLKNQFIDLINQDRQQKQFLHDLRVDKQKRETSINQLSGWVIEKEQLNKYLNILFTHRILGQIIRTKNNNLLKKYSTVQSAYMHIKSNTNIVEFEKILKKMEQQDSIYDITVKKVSDLEAELQTMQKNIQKAKIQRHKILSQEGKAVQLQKNYYQGIQKDRYQLVLSQKQKVQHRINQDDIMKQRIIEWTNRLQEKMNVFKTQGQSIENVLTQCVDRLKTKKKN